MKISVKKTKKSFDFEFDVSFKELSLIAISIKTIILFFSYNQDLKVCHYICFKKL